jgi:hypothetical protein
MTAIRIFANRRSCFVAIVIFLAALFIATTCVSAQTPPDGYNAVCLTSTCTATGIGTTIASSSAFIDASVFCPSGGCSTTYGGNDFCYAVNLALDELATGGLSTYGGVVDARGINPGGAHTCSYTPFTSPHTITTPSTILLPSGTYTIYQTWILPDRTRIIGEGNNPNNGTLIYASSSFPGSSLIQMGSSTLCPSAQCYGISVEYVFLSGVNISGLNGIVNQYGGTSSFVDHVNIYHVLGTGLVIGGSASDSGPYSNIAMSAGASCVAPGGSPPSTSCVHIGDSTFGSPGSTRGVHGLTCTCEGSGTAGGTAQVAVAVNSSNNTLEDMHFEGYIDGIELGYQGNAQNNVILNVNGGGTGKDSMTNIVHVCSSTSLHCANTNTVSDVTIQTAVSTSSGGGTVTNVIADDLTQTTLPSLSTPAVTSVGMYVLGDKMGSTAGAYSRFMTGSTSASATNVSTWSASGSAPSGACQPGSLFSNINGVSASSTTLYVCKVVSGTPTWTPLSH